MPTWEKILASIRNNPNDARFDDVVKVAKHYFGEPRKHGSHRTFNMPWDGDPRVNLQEDKNGKAKAYQVRQLLDSIEKLEERDDDGEV